MTKLALTPYRGSRDFYPEDFALQKFMFNQLREVVSSYGYLEYMGPIIEPLEIYQLKSGQELANEQTYNFVDKSGRKLAIRPEMTPTLSRMIANKRQQLNFPLRWFSIPNLWRYERPQKGRYREHWQLNVDILGIDNYLAEYELLCIIADIFNSFKAQPAAYTIKINHRGLINNLLANYFKLTNEQANDLVKLIDRKNKILASAFIDSLDLILNDQQKQAGTVEQLLTILNSNDLTSLPTLIKDSEDANYLSQLIKQLNNRGINNIEIDFNIMRGLDYYTGVVFEVFDTDPNNQRAILGGGRYDGLIGMFGVNPIPTVGFGLGDAMLEEFLKSHNLLPKLKSTTDIYAAILSSDLAKALAMINSLRDLGLTIAVDYNTNKLAQLFKRADNDHIEHVLILGDKELASNQYTLRRISDSQQTTLSLKDAYNYVHKQ